MLFRIGLDCIAAALLLVALAYYWLDNATHEAIGTGIFLLLIAHNIFNRAWWRNIPKGIDGAHSSIATTLNLSLLVTMLTLMVTSVMISQTVFSFLPIASSATARQLHAAVAYWALIIVAVHLGWQWRTVCASVGASLGITRPSTIRTTVLRLGGSGLAAYGGVRSWQELEIWGKLRMRMPTSLGGWDFGAETGAFFVHHLAVIGLFAFGSHYAAVLIDGRKGLLRAATKPTGSWVRACAVSDIEVSDVIQFDHEGQSFAIYRSSEGELFATAGLCTHQRVCLADGLVWGDTIECPKHHGSFNFKTGEALGAPVIIPLKTYPVRVENGSVMIDVG